VVPIKAVLGFNLTVAVKNKFYSSH